MMSAQMGRRQGSEEAPSEGLRAEDERTLPLDARCLWMPRQLCVPAPALPEPAISSFFYISSCFCCD